MRAAGALGGVQINIDEKAASALNVEAGTRRLNGQDLLYHVSFHLCARLPNSSSPTD